MKKLPILMVIFGVGLFVYGVLNFTEASSGTGAFGAQSSGYSYDLASRFVASAGAMLASAGLLLRSDSSK